MREFDIEILEANFEELMNFLRIINGENCLRHGRGSRLNLSCTSKPAAPSAITAHDDLNQTRSVILADGIR
jgi:hypothetical protein